MTYGSLDEDVLRGCSCGTDTVDTGLVELGDDGVSWHVVVFVVAVKDDQVVGCELGGDVVPEGLEVRGG